MGHAPAESPFPTPESRERRDLTGSRLLARNTLYNLVGQGAPLVAAVFAIPLLIQGLGVDRFGVLGVAWMLIGYFGLLDFGVGKALTLMVSAKTGEGREEEVPVLTWSALLLMVLMGCLGTAVLGLASPWLVRVVLKVPEAIQAESIQALWLLVASLPLVICTVGLRGVLEAKQEFALVNAIRVPMGVFSYVGPLAVLPFSSSLVPVVAVSVLGRVLAFAAHLLFCLRTVPALRSRVEFRRSAVRPLLSFGGWMTVSNVVSPVMMYVDRLLIGSLLSVSAVAYYVTPYEVVTKLSIVSGALTGVLFPAFAATYVRDPARTAVLFCRGLKVVLLVLFPVSLAVVMLAHDGLTLWLGSDFARQSVPVLQWLAIGVFVNGVANVPFNVIQGAGRADIVAKVHLVELPLYLAALGWLIHTQGITGAAMAWTLRVTVDALVMLAVAERIIPSGAAAVRRIAVGSGAAVFLLALGMAVPAAPVVRQGFLVLVSLLFVPSAWFLFLDAEDRRGISRYVASRSGVP
jgi:O-antigen/teichoic acid export membrane protein